MKVVIDIPENDYKLACNYPDALIACYAHYIKAGVPLPKKYGKLIDGIELIDYCKDMMRLLRESDEDMRDIIISDICCQNVIRKIINMPTLLEAEGMKE